MAAVSSWYDAHAVRRRERVVGTGSALLTPAQWAGIVINGLGVAGVTFDQPPAIEVLIGSGYESEPDEMDAETARKYAADLIAAAEWLEAQA